MEKVKILVVDDESRMRKLVKDFLSREGYTVLEAADGVEAMDIFYEDKDIAMIILDVMMPRMDGWQVCREIRESSKVPVIMLTARSEERDELQGFELGGRIYFKAVQSENPCGQSECDPEKNAWNRGRRRDVCRRDCY